MKNTNLYELFSMDADTLARRHAELKNKLRDGLKVELQKIRGGEGEGDKKPR